MPAPSRLNAADEATEAEERRRRVLERLRRDNPAGLADDDADALALEETRAERQSRLDRIAGSSSSTATSSSARW